MGDAWPSPSRKSIGKIGIFGTREPAVTMVTLKPRFSRRLADNHELLWDPPQDHTNMSTHRNIIVLEAVTLGERGQRYRVIHEGVAPAGGDARPARQVSSAPMGRIKRKG
jgi:hypothetical protein